MYLFKVKQKISKTMIKYYFKIKNSALTLLQRALLESALNRVKQSLSSFDLSLVQFPT